MKEEYCRAGSADATIESALKEIEDTACNKDYCTADHMPKLLATCRELVRVAQHYDTREYHSTRDNDGQIQYVAEMGLARATALLAGSGEG